MTKLQNTNSDVINIAHKNVIYDALRNFQAIEHLLKACIKVSDYIINTSCNKHVTFTPKRTNLEEMGLGGIAEIYKAITKNKNLCKEIKDLSKQRNLLAHSELLPTLRLTFTNKEISTLQHRTMDIRQVSDKARKIFLELGEEYQKLLKIKNKLKKL